jgi:hypothetical protein
LSEHQLPCRTGSGLTPPDEGVPEPTTTTTAAPARTAFIEPDISAPVDVLEATTFFQAATSGGTN